MHALLYWEARSFLNSENRCSGKNRTKRNQSCIQFKFDLVVECERNHNRSSNRVAAEAKPPQRTSTVDDGLWQLWTFTVYVCVRVFLKRLTEVATVISFGKLFLVDTTPIIKEIVTLVAALHYFSYRFREFLFTHSWCAKLNIYGI